MSSIIHLKVKDGNYNEGRAPRDRHTWLGDDNSLLPVNAHGSSSGGCRNASSKNAQCQLHELLQSLDNLGFG